MSNNYSRRSRMKHCLIEPARKFVCAGFSSGPALKPWGRSGFIGTGIFVLTGVAAHDLTGPALMLSFVVSGITVFLRLVLRRVRVHGAGSVIGVTPTLRTWANYSLDYRVGFILEYQWPRPRLRTAGPIFSGFSFLLHIGLHTPSRMRPFDYDLSSGRLTLTGPVRPAGDRDRRARHHCSGERNP